MSCPLPARMVEKVVPTAGALLAKMQRRITICISPHFARAPPDDEMGILPAGLLQIDTTVGHNDATRWHRSMQKLLYSRIVDPRCLRL
jgi:hypothetical protein